MKVIFLNFISRIKMVNTETGKDPRSSCCPSLRAFFRPKSVLNCFPLFLFPEVVTTTHLLLTSSFPGMAVEQDIMPCSFRSLSTSLLSQKQRALFFGLTIKWWEKEEIIKIRTIQRFWIFLFFSVMVLSVSDSTDAFSLFESRRQHNLLLHDFSSQACWLFTVNI